MSVFLYNLKKKGAYLSIASKKEHPSPCISLMAVRFFVSTIYAHWTSHEMCTKIEIISLDVFIGWLVEVLARAEFEYRITAPLPFVLSVPMFSGDNKKKLGICDGFNKFVT